MIRAPHLLNLNQSLDNLPPLALKWGTQPVDVPWVRNLVIIVPPLTQKLGNLLLVAEVQENAMQKIAKTNYQISRARPANFVH